MFVKYSVLFFSDINNPDSSIILIKLRMEQEKPAYYYLRLFLNKPKLTKLIWPNVSELSRVCCFH